MNGILSGLPPGLAGYVASQQQQQQQQAAQLQKMQGILSLQNALEGQQLSRQTNPLQVKLLEAQLAKANAPRPLMAVPRGSDLIDPSNPAAPVYSNPAEPKQPRVHFDAERGVLIDLDTGLSRPIPGVSPKPKEPKASRTQYDPERGVMVNLDTGVATPIAGVGPKPEKPTAQQQQQVVGVNNTRNAIETYREALKNFGSMDVLNPAKRAEIGTAYNNMLLQAKEAYNLGVLNGPDYMILQQVITNPASATGAITPRKSLESQLTQLDSIMERVGQTVRNSPTSPLTPRSQISSSGGFKVLGPER